MSNEWQPIETAPRDGTRILVCYPQSTWNKVNGRKKWYIKTTINTADFNERGHGTLAEGCGISLECCTHWMPLPPPPVKEKTDE